VVSLASIPWHQHPGPPAGLLRKEGGSKAGGFTGSLAACHLRHSTGPVDVKIWELNI
jgi:hypothetical protein